MANDPDPSQPDGGASPDEAAEAGAPDEPVRIIEELQPVPVPLRDLPANREETAKPAPAEPRPVKTGPKPKARRPAKSRPAPETPEAPALESNWAGDDRVTRSESAERPRGLLDVDLGRQRQQKNERARKPKGASSPKTPQKAANEPLPAETSPEPAKKKLGFFARLGLGIRDLVLVSFACIPAVGAAWIVDWKAVNVPFGPEWERVDVLQALHEEKLSASEFLAPEYGQRQTVPKGMHLFLTRLTGGDVRAEVWASFGALAACAAGLFFMLGRTVGTGLKLGLTFLLANLLLFSPVHAQALLSASAFGVHLANACLIWAIFLASGTLPWWLRLGFCLFFGVLGSYSAIHGLAIWPAVAIVQILGSHAGKIWQRLIFLVVWLAIAGFVIGDYFSETGAGGDLSFPALEAVKQADAEQLVTEWFTLAGDLIFRGWQAPENREFVVLPGLAVVAIFLIHAIVWLASTLGRSRVALWNRCLPWIALGASGLVGTALVCLFVDRGAIPAPGLDFSLVVTPVLAGIMALFTILTSDKVERSPESGVSDHLPILWAVVLFGMVLHQAGGWFYGYWRVNEVQAQRLKTRSQMLFMNQFPPGQPSGFGTDDWDLAQKRATFLNQNGYLIQPILSDLRLAPPRFRLEPEALPASLAALNIPELSGDEIQFSGSARLPGLGYRPADVVALVRNYPERGIREILTIASAVEEIPNGWRVTTTNPANEPIEFWALDLAKMVAYPFNQRFALRDGLPVLEKVSNAK